MRFLVVYDIAHPKRLHQVAKIMKDFGTRVQLSKFEMDLSERQVTLLKARIAKVIVPEEDGVKYIPQCTTCRAKMEIIGRGGVVPADADFDVF